MSSQPSVEMPQPHEGEQYLKLLGMEELADEPIAGHPDKQFRDFLDICGQHARNPLTYLSSLDPENPTYEQLRGLLRRQIGAYVVVPDRI